MGTRSFAPPILIPPRPSPDASMNGIYYGFPGISYVHFVGSVTEICISCLITSINFLTAVDFSIFIHDGYHPITEFTGVNSPSVAGMPIFLYWNFPITERNIL